MIHTSWVFGFYSQQLLKYMLVSSLIPRSHASNLIPTCRMCVAWNEPSLYPSMLLVLMCFVDLHGWYLDRCVFHQPVVQPLHGVHNHVNIILCQNLVTSRPNYASGNLPPCGLLALFPGLPQLHFLITFLHTVSGQKLEVWKAWERG